MALPLRDTWKTLSPEAASEVSNGNTRKIFKDLNEFDPEDSDLLLDWLEELDMAFQAATISDDTAKIYLAVSKCAKEYRKEIATRDEVRGHSYEKFKEMLLEDFPEAANLEEGSISRLRRILHRYRQVKDWDLERLKGYNRAFKLEVDKLMKEPAVINNYNAVQYYLSGLDEYWRGRLIQVMGDLTREKTKKDRTQSRTKLRRHDDPWKLKEVMEEMENLMAAGDGSVYVKMNDLSLSDPLLKDSYKGKSSSVAQSKPVTKTGASIIPTPTTRKSKKPEEDVYHVKEELEDSHLREDDDEDGPLNIRVAASVDGHTASIRAHDQEIKVLKDSAEQVKILANEVQGLKKTLEDMPKRIQTSWTTPARGYGQDSPNRSFNVGGTDRAGCYFCKEQTHRVKECPYQRKLIEKGWIVWNDKMRAMLLKDGSLLPRPGPGERVMDKTIEYIKAKGWDKGSLSDMFFLDIEDPMEMFYQNMGNMSMGNEMQAFAMQAAVAAYSQAMASVESKN